VFPWENSVKAIIPRSGKRRIVTAETLLDNVLVYFPNSNDLEHQKDDIQTVLYNTICESGKNNPNKHLNTYWSALSSRSRKRTPISQDVVNNNETENEVTYDTTIQQETNSLLSEVHTLCETINLLKTQEDESINNIRYVNSLYENEKNKVENQSAEINDLRKQLSSLTLDYQSAIRAKVEEITIIEESVRTYESELLTLTNQKLDLEKSINNRKTIVVEKDSRHQDKKNLIEIQLEDVRKNELNNNEIVKVMEQRINELQIENGQLSLELQNLREKDIITRNVVEIDDSKHYESAFNAKDEEIKTLQLSVTRVAIQHKKELEDVKNEFIGKCRDLENYQAQLSDEIIDLNQQVEYSRYEREDFIAQVNTLLQDNENLKNQSRSDRLSINALQTQIRDLSLQLPYRALREDDINDGYDKGYDGNQDEDVQSNSNSVIDTNVPINDNDFYKVKFVLEDDVRYDNGLSYTNKDYSSNKDISISSTASNYMGESRQLFHYNNSDSDNNSDSSVRANPTDKDRKSNQIETFYNKCVFQQSRNFTSEVHDNSNSFVGYIKPLPSKFYTEVGNINDYFDEVKNYVAHEVYSTLLNANKILTNCEKKPYMNQNHVMFSVSLYDESNVDESKKLFHLVDEVSLKLKCKNLENLSSYDKIGNVFHLYDRN
jgi:hypothetical protein